MDIFYQPAKYRLKVTSAALGESKPRDDGTTTPQVEVGIKILGEYAEGELLPCDGPTRLVFLTLTPNTLGTAAQPGWVAQTLADLGFVGPSFANLSPLIGKERDGECKHDDYTGKTLEKWAIYRDGRAPIRPVDARGTRALDSQYKDLLKVIGQQKGGSLPGAASRPAQKPAAQQGSTRLPDKTAADYGAGPDGPLPTQPSTFPQDGGGEEIPF